MRFLGLSLADRVPDANSIWNSREALTPVRMDDAPAIEVLFRCFDAMLGASGYIAMGGQIIEATVMTAPKQRNTEEEKRAPREGHVLDEWRRKPAKLAQKGRDARWILQHSEAKPAADGAKCIDIATPRFGYKNRLGIDRRHGLIRTWSAANHDGAQLAGLLDRTNTAGGVWADIPYRSEKNEAHFGAHGFISRIHRKRPKGKPMLKRTARANAL